MAKNKTTLLDGNQINTGEGLVTDPVTGKLAVNTSGIRETIGIGDLGRLNSAPLVKGGTGSSEANQARKNLGLGTAANYNVGTAPGNVPIIGANSEIAAKEFVTGTTSKVTDKEVIFNGETVLKTPATLTALQASLVTLLAGSDPVTVAQANAMISEINAAITVFNAAMTALATHHKLIK